MLEGVKLAFSDESGKIKSKNWYVRIVYIVDSLDYKSISSEFISLKKEFNIPRDKEFKFNWLWKLEKHRKDIKRRDPCYFFRHYKTDDLKEFIIRSIELLDEFDPILIVVYTYIFGNFYKSQVEIEYDFMKTILARLEYEFSAQNSFGIIFYDESSHRDALSGAYKKIFINAKYVKEYAHIKDSLSFDISKYSAGIQLADYIAGITHNFLRNYRYSSDIFKRYLFNWIRRVDKLSIKRTGLIPLYLEKTEIGKNILIDISKKINEIVKYSSGWKHDNTPTDYR